ncbi:unnamed protein product [Adineta ricciae]|uniref:Uncharacterized protein n=1 Tax=Adineta ricciae TaxID=249248 RepID=A0A815CEG8_ADIRI|nr:unnamed protein product [Adineta ricciae]CAF1286124.1 unnamed protein product [Adineta ricciae]
MRRIILLLVFNCGMMANSMELKSLNSCQTPLLSASKILTSSTDFTSNTWCPSSSDHDRYLIFSLSNLTYLTRLTAKAEISDMHYYLEYTRDNSIDEHTAWRSYPLMNHKDEKMHLNPPIIAKYIRIQVKQTKVNLCIEIELFGCVFTDGVISYNMLQGARQLEDDTYDGQYDENRRFLHDGLGQLSDGQTGPDNHEDLGGLQWVGWRRPRSAKQNYSIGILFKFDTLRNFSRLTIHANNYFPKKIYVFRSVALEFVHDENSTFLTYHHQRDDQFEMARPIMIDLKNQIASQLKIHFYFDSSWILISEMTFDSFVVSTETPIKTEQTSQSVLILIGILIMIMIVILIIIICLIRSLTKNYSDRKKSYLSPMHNQTDSSASTTSSEIDATSSHHRYATIGPMSPYSLSTKGGNLVCPSYAKLIPTTLIRSPSLTQQYHIEGVCGNSTYGSQRVFTFDTDQHQFIPSHHITITQRFENRHQILGGGEICHGTLQVNQSLLPITIRRLLSNASVQSKISFYNEISLLTSLCHPNIVHAYGFCSEPTISLLTESFDSSSVDLYQYLQHHKHEQPEDSALYTTTVFFASQVSSALAYLESLRICHRDVAARNCLVSLNLNIKLYDLAMCNEMYADDYVLVSSVGTDSTHTRRPIRWCAWETICLNQFTSKSDVFSFGVLLWEMLTLVERPHSLLDDEQVLYNLQHSCHSLTIPSCANDLTDLILSCWQKYDYDRPAFYQLNHALNQLQQALSIKSDSYQQID